MKKIVVVLLALVLLCCGMTFTASAGEVLILEKGTASIRGLLPDSWQEIGLGEREAFLRQNGKILEPAGKLLSVFHRKSDIPETAPVVFVFHAGAEQKVTEEQRAKMYAWFEKNREDVAWLVAPDKVKSMSLENIEYLHDHDTLIFDTSVEVGGRKMHGVSGIVFLERGYLNIIGYEIDDSNRYRGDFYTFIKTLSIPKELKYSANKGVPMDLAWFAGHWQQLTGVFLFMAVYGLVFLRKENKLLPAS